MSKYSMYDAQVMGGFEVDILPVCLQLRLFLIGSELEYREHGEAGISDGGSRETANA